MPALYFFSPSNLSKHALKLEFESLSDRQAQEGEMLCIIVLSFVHLIGLFQ